MRKLTFLAIVALVTLSPWFFAAWEMWWFWSFACLFALAVVLFCLSKAFPAAGIAPLHRDMVTSFGFAGLSLGLFLAYALVRTIQADVYMDAERSFLLFATPAGRNRYSQY